ncbi:hypothetical protein QWZ10_21510 [Paracoccus cavernae]|uniref:Uncharacterized protein n=1 Tax=Paracoccus cavernae TaxID=1571207 RepID=A0ABT8DCY1_9RHOB|nr:hypothetical protein [Paracoccus cavernae]
MRADDVAAAPLPPRDAMGVSHELRATLRREDAAAFADLLEQGAFDPDADRMAAAIQTELFRMSCYASTVDGLWGAVRSLRSSVTLPQPTSVRPPQGPRWGFTVRSSRAPT